ncbi:MAG TPA: CAP domain-containing protein [Nocardioides sp.]|nr:CAP domain-containing protein [Nocardioides sp.]
MNHVRRTLAAVTAALVVGVLPGPAHASVASAADATANRTVATRTIDTAAYGRRVLTLTNERRARHGCHALRWQYQLQRSAQQHTNLMSSRDVLSHLLASELGLVARILRVGYHPWSRLAENIAVGYTTPAQVVTAWMHSPEHRRNILDCRLRDLGVGVRLDDYGTVWWTQDFGRH